MNALRSVLTERAGSAKGPAAALERFRRQASAKLGRCPYCIRAAARGTVGSWIATAVLCLAWPHPVPVSVALAVALGFTALFVAHLLAYTWRAVPRLLCAMNERSRLDPDVAGRRFVGSALRRSTTAVAMSLLGFGRTLLAGAGAVQVDRREIRKRAGVPPMRLRLEALEGRVAPVSPLGDSDVLANRPATEGVCPTCGTK
jgi:hypothetical protein